MSAEAEFVAGNACDQILDALPMDSWGHIISCGYDDNDERCDCGTLRARLERIVAERVREAVEQERAAWAAKFMRDDSRRLMAQEYLADMSDYHGQDLTRHAQAMAAAVRALLATDDTQDPS